MDYYWRYGVSRGKFIGKNCLRGQPRASRAFVRYEGNFWLVRRCRKETAMEEKSAATRCARGNWVFLAGSRQPATCCISWKARPDCTRCLHAQPLLHLDILIFALTYPLLFTPRSFSVYRDPGYQLTMYREVAPFRGDRSGFDGARLKRAKSTSASSVSRGNKLI